MEELEKAEEEDGHGGLLPEEEKQKGGAEEEHLKIERAGMKKKTNRYHKQGGD